MSVKTIRVPWTLLGRPVGRAGAAETRDNTHPNPPTTSQVAQVAMRHHLTAAKDRMFVNTAQEINEIASPGFLRKMTQDFLPRKAKFNKGAGCRNNFTICCIGRSPGSDREYIR